ncbi:MAG: rRNA pseudouridine synthase [Chloroflexi bacterium]|nr:rRNA pseudouridine synthase [Chloroflexota bacterium]
MQERLQKILANAGVASRRATEEMIRAGRVTVNEKVVTRLGTRADPLQDRIAVDGRLLRCEAELVYLAVNKPQGYISTARDTHGRKTVLDLAPKMGRLYPVGRLDADSEGLILLTNDGDLAYRLTHPSFVVEKEYRVLVEGHPSSEKLARLRQGVEIDGEVSAPAKVEETGREDGNTWLRLVIHEGRKRQIRRMAEAVGHPVIKLMRTRIGSLRLGELAPGQFRRLAPGEVQKLFTGSRKKTSPRSVGKVG